MKAQPYLPENDLVLNEGTTWGKIENLAENEQFSVKIFSVKPHTEIEPQAHRYQSRLLKVLSGKPVITIDKDSVTAVKGDKFYVPTRSEHQIATHSSKAEILEVTFLW